MKKKICCGIALCIATQALATKGEPPLGFSKQPHYPKTLSSCANSTLNYTLQNNTNVTLPLTFSSTISEGTFTANGGTCGTTLSAGSTCTKSYSFTPPDNATSSPKTVTGTIQVAYNGRYPLKDTGIQFSITPDSAAALEFISNSPFPLAVPSEQSIPFYYELKNNADSAISITSFNPSVPLGTGSVSTTSGGCGSSIAACGVCTQHFTYTAPLSLGTTVTGSMSVSYTHSGPQTLTGTNPVFTVTPVTKPSITITNPNLMFLNRNSGQSSTYTGTLTVQNNGQTTLTNLTASATSGGGNTITPTVPSACNTLAPNATCKVSFTSAIPVDTDATVILTPSDPVVGNSVSAKVSAISVTPLAPPTDTSVGLTLVNGCNDSTNDGGLLLITNNSSEPLSDITITNPGGTLATLTITNPINSLYCNGNTIDENQYCEVRVASSAAANSTGNLIFSGILHTNTGTTTAHHVTMPTKVVGRATSFPYAVNTQKSGGTIFVADQNCNLVEVSNPDSSISGATNWFGAAQYCSTLSVNSFSDWRLPDLGPETNTLFPGEFASLKLVLPNPPNFYWGPIFSLSPAPAAEAWSVRLTGGRFGPGASIGPANINEANASCVRAFTTDSNGT